MVSHGKRKAAIIASAAVLCENDDDDDVLTIVNSRSMPRFKRPSVIRKRQTFSSVTNSLSDFEFKRAFRMSRPSFMLLLSRLRSSLQRNEVKAKCSSSECNKTSGSISHNPKNVSSEFLSRPNDGVWCCCMTFQIFHYTLNQVVQELSMPGIPLGSTAELRKPADNFQTSRNRENPL